MSADLLCQPVINLAGVGAQTTNRLAKLGIASLQDLLFHLPNRYEDRTRICPMAELASGMVVLVCGQVGFADILPRGRRSLVCKISDGTGELFLRFFHYTVSQQQLFRPDTWLSAFGEVRIGQMGLEMVHPEYSVVKNPAAISPETGLTPVYPLTEGLSQSVVRKAVQQVLRLCQQQPQALAEWLPPALLPNPVWPTLWQALQTVHTPQDATATWQAGDNPAIKRLAFEELLAHHLRLALARQQAQSWQAPVFGDAAPIIQNFLAALPFQPTRAQQRVMAEIAADCAQAKPMLRLVQGDVGSGKTLVAAYAALLAIASGNQVALMAPTELLAEQHLRNFKHWFAGLEVTIGFLSGQSQGRIRQAVQQGLADGFVHLVIGTHALFQDAVQFARLGLVIIDEQHRFGVHQRLALREKSRHTGLRPHQLVMTATPIPRTLAMLQYADLDVSVIDELPPGRKPVVTRVIPSERRPEVMARIQEWVGKGRQAYWVCTLISESDVLQCQAAEQTATLLAENLPEVRVGLVHGRMKSADKETVMQAFKQHQIDLLVATTVIEVGVDVPNAGLMIIENPERLGLSQLHQLRGRVGRGPGESFCLLLYQAPLSDTARQRLGILRDSNDGFVIAEQDLLLRGPGDLLGTRQTGAMMFKIADLQRDAELLPEVAVAGARLLAEFPELAAPICQRWLGAASRYAEV